MYAANEKIVQTARVYLSELEEAIVTSPYVWITVPLLLAIVDRETLWGWARTYSAPGKPDGTGDRGHGHGFFQIDDRSHNLFIGTGMWSNVRIAAQYAIDDVLGAAYRYLRKRLSADAPGVSEPRSEIDLQWDAVAAYNCGAANVEKSVRNGRDRDARTTGGDYSRDVKKRMEFWSEWYENERSL